MSGSSVHAGTARSAPGLAALDRLFEPFARSDAPGLVVGVAHASRVVYRRGFGLASVELGVANAAATRMRIGSTSKHFTCLAVLLLAEEGRVDLDSSVRRYVPELPVLAGEPTLRQLMNHTGGYRCYLDLGLVADGLAVQPRGTALATQVRQTAANFRPGEKLIYCNGGYHLLSVVVDRVSGVSFERFLEQRIFAPLGMVDTASVPSDLEIHRGMATLHLAQPDGSWRRGIFPSEEVRGEGGIVSTLDDMLAWLAHLRAAEKTVGSPDSWRQMLEPAKLNDGTVSKYALGLIREDYRGLEVIHHGGAVFGGTCQMITAPGAALDVVIMTNGALANAPELALRIIDELGAEALRGPATPRAAVDRFRAMLGQRYHCRTTGIGIGFGEAADGRLGLSILNFVPIALKETDAGQALTVGVEDIAVGPLTVRTADLAESGEAPESLRFSEAGHEDRFERMPANPPVLADAAPSLLGRYRAADLAADADLRLVDGKLLLHIAGVCGGNTLALEVWSADVFAWAGVSVPMLRGLINVKRDPSGVVEGFSLDTMRTRGLSFQRQPS